MISPLTYRRSVDQLDKLFRRPLLAALLSNDEQALESAKTQYVQALTDFERIWRPQIIKLMPEGRRKFNRHKPTRGHRKPALLEKLGPAPTRRELESLYETVLDNLRLVEDRAIRAACFAKRPLGLKPTEVPEIAPYKRGIAAALKLREAIIKQYPACTDLPHPDPRVG